MAKYYLLITCMFYGWYGSCQNCTAVDVLQDNEGWSGAVERFFVSPEGWALQDSIARESEVVYRFDSLMTALRFGFSLDFSPSTANLWEITIGLENDDSTATGQLVLRIGESGDHDGVVSTLKTGAGVPVRESFWRGDYGDGVSQASWALSVRSEGISVSSGPDNEYFIHWDTTKWSDLLIRSVRLTCRYTKTRASAFDFHYLYPVNPDQSVLPEIEPGELFISEYNWPSDIQNGYIELFNVLDESICAYGLIISLNNEPIYLPSVTLYPGAFVVLVDSSFSQTPATSSRQIPVAFPLDIQPGAVEIKLFQFGRMLHGVQVPSVDLGPTEMVDITRPCRRDNWKLSGDGNGSRGMENSWFGTLHDPVVTFAWESDISGVISFPFVWTDGHFPENLITMDHPFQWIDGDIWGKKVFRLSGKIPDGDSIHIRIYGSHRVCSEIPFTWDTLISALPARPGEKGNLRITEIMYEPIPGCPEYFEIANVLGRSTWWQELWIQKNGDELLNLPVGGDWPSQECRIVTGDAVTFLNCYPETAPDLVHEVDLFVLNNNGATLSLSSGEDYDRLIDQTTYHPSDHHELFRSTAGVVLERNIYQLQGNKWRSGFVQLGYRSPGFLPEWEEKSESLVEFSTTTIYPGGVREPSVLQIEIGGESVDGNITIEIFDLKGWKVSTLADAVPLQGGEVFSWDGTTSAGVALPEGLYLFWIYFFDVTGHQKTIKKTCALSSN